MAALQFAFGDRCHAAFLDKRQGPPPAAARGLHSRLIRVAADLRHCWMTASRFRR
jgi:hypothetical protein